MEVAVAVAVGVGVGAGVRVWVVVGVGVGVWVMPWLGVLDEYGPGSGWNYGWELELGAFVFFFSFARRAVSVEGRCLF